MKKILITLFPLFLMSAQAWSVSTRFVHMGRQFVLYAPKNAVAKNLPLVVLLHGCRQDATMFLDGTKFDAEADQRKFMILAPEQPSIANYKQCWNWFLDIHQNRNLVNEMGQVVSAVELITKRYQLNAERIFVAGISAGGGMAHNLAVCYPDVFAGAAIHSGLNFKVAETIPEAETVLTSPHQKSPDYLGKRMAGCALSVRKHRLKKVLVIHGNNDQVVPPLHADLITSSHAVWRDFLDDGKRNDSVRGVSHTQNFYFPQGYSAVQTDTQYPSFTERKIIVKGLNHAWGGGKRVSQYFDPEAPSSNKFIFDFFDINK